MSGTQPPTRNVAGPAANVQVPIGARLAGEIVKPRDPYVFQRYCVVLFREELGDPNTKEYGRNGQAQGGIDILGYRNGDPKRAVGIQCRNIQNSLSLKKILSDCREALALEFGLVEIIFATTAPDDTKSDKAAKEAERLLRAEGHDLTVHVYGWGQLQTLIAQHERAYLVFMPALAAATQPVDIASSVGTSPTDISALAAVLVDEMERRGMGNNGITLPPKPAGPDGIGSESPALHARIDVFRDLIRGGEGRSAVERLIELRDSAEAEDAPWARYRIETNIAASLMDQGREAEAADCYVRAHAIRPDDPNAICNLAIARTIQGDPEEGMRLARSVLDGPNPVEFAVSALLQAAARSKWQGDPETLIPSGMVGSTTVQLALADFMRRRWLPGWEAHVLALPDDAGSDRDNARMKALAVLSIAIDSRVHVVGGRDTVSDKQLDEAATTMLTLATHCLRNGYAYLHDLMAHVSNGALLLRLARRGADAEALLREGIKSLPEDEQLRRLLAVVLMDAGRGAEAATVLGTAVEPETQLMKIQLDGEMNFAQRLQKVVEMEAPSDERVASIRRRLMAELALAADDMTTAKSVVAEMLDHPDDVISARLIDIERQRKEGMDEEAGQNLLASLANELPMDAELIDRFLVAQALLDADLAGSAAELVEGHVDLQSPRPATFMYLTALAEARRDDTYRKSLAAASEVVRDHPGMLWLDARHAWNAGDLQRSLGALDRFLVAKPNKPRAVLMRLEVLIRLNRSREILDVLDSPIENLEWTNDRDPYRIVSLLTHFGYHDRAARLAYRLFLEQRDKPRAWMTLSGMTIRDGQAKRANQSDWAADRVADDVAVDLEFDDGSKTFFIVEADARLRQLDPESWEPEHALVKAVRGLAVDDRFEASDRRQGKVAKLRHKIVARFHYVLENYETRFPEVFGFKSFSVDTSSPNGLDEMIAQLKDRHDWVLAEQEQHIASGMPLDLLAEQNIALKVAEGTEPERLAANEAIKSNERLGCVMGLATFWSAWRLGALNSVREMCGPICVPRGVVDRLAARRERYDQSIANGHGTLSYLEGKILHTEIPGEQMETLRDDIDAALAWIEINDAAKPIVLDDTASQSVRDYVQAGRTDMLDATILAVTTDRLLISDDIAMRAMHRALGGTRSAWLHAVLTNAHVAGHVDSERLTQQTSDLVRSGHSYLGVTGSMMALAVQMDLAEDGAMGARSIALIERLGGEVAEPLSHVQAACEALHHLWNTDSVRSAREAASGKILENLLKGRPKDWDKIFAAVARFASANPGLRQYVRDWGRGHFLPGYV